MNIDNGRAWTVETVQVCGLSDEDQDAAVPMCMDDSIHAEGNEVFITQYREIATARLGQPQAVGG